METLRGKGDREVVPLLINFFRATSYCDKSICSHVFLANLFLKEAVLKGISSDYVSVDFICMGLLDL